MEKIIAQGFGFGILSEGIFMFAFKETKSGWVSLHTPTTARPKLKPEAQLHQAPTWVAGEDWAILC